MGAYLRDPLTLRPILSKPPDTSSPGEAGKAQHSRFTDGENEAQRGIMAAQDQSWNPGAPALCPGHFHLVGQPPHHSDTWLGRGPGVEGTRLLGCWAGVTEEPPAPGGVSAQGTGLPRMGPTGIPGHQGRL